MGARRQALEATGVRFISARERLIKLLMKLALHVDPDIALALFRDVGDERYASEIDPESERPA